MLPDDILKQGKIIYSVPKVYQYNGIKIKYASKNNRLSNPKDSEYITINNDMDELIELSGSISEGLSAVSYISENEFSYTINI